MPPVMMTAAAPRPSIGRAAYTASTDSMRRPLSTSASGMFGVTTRERGSTPPTTCGRRRRPGACRRWTRRAQGRRPRAGRSSSDNRRRHGLDDRGGGEHAHLRRIDRGIAGDGFDLGGHQVGGQRGVASIPGACAVTAVTRSRRRGRKRPMFSGRPGCRRRRSESLPAIVSVVRNAKILASCTELCSTR